MITNFNNNIFEICGVSELLLIGEEEEDLWNYNLERAKLADGDKAATLILDHEMAQREANGNKKYKCMK